MAASMPGAGGADLWTLDGRRIAQLTHDGKGVSGIAFSPDSSLLATAGADGALRLWQAEDGRLLRTFRGHEGGLTDVAFSPDGDLLASSGFDGTVRLWARLDLNLDDLTALAVDWLREYGNRDSLSNSS